jgi:hypothetical protein
MLYKKRRFLLRAFCAIAQAIFQHVDFKEKISSGTVAAVFWRHRSNPTMGRQGRELMWSGKSNHPFAGQPLRQRWCYQP